VFSPQAQRALRDAELKHADFSVQIVSEAFRGKVRVFQTALRTSPVFTNRPVEYSPAPQIGERCACGRVQERASRAFSDHQDARRTSEGHLIGRIVSEGDLHVVAVAFMSYLLLPCSTKIRRIPSVTWLTTARSPRIFIEKKTALHSLRSRIHLRGPSSHLRSPKTTSVQTIDGEL